MRSSFVGSFSSSVPSSNSRDPSSPPLASSVHRHLFLNHLSQPPVFKSQCIKCIDMEDLHELCSLVQNKISKGHLIPFIAVAKTWLKSYLTDAQIRTGGWGVDTNWNGHHDGGVVGRGGQFPLSENVLSGQKMQ